MTRYLEIKPGSLEEVVKTISDDYQDVFKKELEKTGKSLNQMTDSEKKAFFNKIDKMYNAKNEELSAAQKKLPPALQKAIKDKTEAVDNPYAVGMAQAMKAKDDQPPLKKSTITKAHDIAKSIEKDQKNEQVSQKEVDKFHTSLDKLVHKSFGHSSDEKKKEMKKETHSFDTNKKNEKQKEVGGEKEIITKEAVDAEAISKQQEKLEICHLKYHL
jgi:ribosomal protein S17E